MVDIHNNHQFDNNIFIEVFSDRWDIYDVF
jgi:hypothetical protein